MDNLFTKQLEQLRNILQDAAEMRTRGFDPSQVWPLQDRPELVLGADMGLELGNPASKAASLFMWTSPENLHPGQITLLGPDLEETDKTNIPWVKIMLFGIKKLAPEDIYPAYRRLADLKYDLHFKGVLLRSASSLHREWLKISKQALSTGFNLFRMAQTLISEYQKLDFVQEVEVILVTGHDDLITRLAILGLETGKIYGALNKMAEEIKFDCTSCEYQSVCKEVAPLRAMHKRLSQKQQSPDN